MYDRKKPKRLVQIHCYDPRGRTAVLLCTLCLLNTVLLLPQLGSNRSEMFLF
jgi:hypothetical protein